MISPLADKLIEQLIPMLSKYNFMYTKKSRAFYKKIHKCRLAFYISVIKHKNDFDTTCSMGIRYDEVEDKIVNVSGEQKKESTLGIEIGNYIYGKQKRWNVKEERDVTAVSLDIFQEFRDHCITFYDKYSNMKNAFDDMKKNDRQAFLLLPFHSERAKRVVVMGMLLGIGGVDLVEIQRSILIELKDPTIDKFDAFVTKLYSEI